MAWLAVARQIVAHGIVSRYEDLPVREISLVTLVVDRPDPNEEIITRHADPERLAWMHANLAYRSRVAALGDADSYASELGRPVGRLLMIVKSAHVYETEFAYVADVLAAQAGGRGC